MEQAILILIILLVSFLNWAFKEGGLRDLMRGRGEQDAAPRPGTAPPSSLRPARRASDETDEEERVRRFLEALGLPTDGVAPVPQPAIPAPVPQAPPPPPAPPAPRSVAEGTQSIRDAMARQRGEENAFLNLRGRKAPDPESRLNAGELAALKRVRADKAVWDIRDHRKQDAPVRYGNLFGSREALRNAVILREVLGPPRAFDMEIDLPTIRRR